MQAREVPQAFVSAENVMEEAHEGYQFTPNSMLAFYPRQVRKILLRRKATNSANSAMMSELKALRAPKHKNKIKKTMSKMQNLAVCQMNMMQLLLQKVSQRSKDIRKQEKIVNENLKRKRIFLERENFDLMPVLRRSLEESESREMSAQNLAQKSTIRSDGIDTTPQSDIKLGSEMPQATQSAKGSTTGAAEPSDGSSTAGCISRNTHGCFSGGDVSILLDISRSIRYNGFVPTLILLQIKARICG